jgi:hypothetical protein
VRRVTLLVAVLAVLVSAAGLAERAESQTVGLGDVVISQFYAHGGDAGASYANDYIELHNRTGGTINLTGWSVQTAASGQNIGETAALRANLNGTLAAGQFLLIQGASGGAGGAALPTPDANGAALVPQGGKIALLTTQTALNCNPGTTTCDLSNVIDILGYGATDFFLGSGPAPTSTTQLAVLRGDGGCLSNFNNSTDFAQGLPNPRNTATAASVCVLPDVAPSVVSTNPVAGATGVALNANIVITFSEAVNVFGTPAINCSLSGAHASLLNSEPAIVTLNPDVDFVLNETCTVTVTKTFFADMDANDPPDTMAADYIFSFSTGAGGGGGSSAGNLTTAVNVLQPEAPCLLLSTSQVNYGTLPFSSPLATSTGNANVTVSSCSTQPEDILVKGTDAVSSTSPASWDLTAIPGSGNMCNAPADGVNEYGQRVSGGGGNSISLSLDNQTYFSGLAASADVNAQLQIFMPCSGSNGAGETMSAVITFTAVQP